MPVNLAPSGVEYIRFLPEIILIATGTLLMVLDAILRERSPDAYGRISIVALVAAMGASVLAYQSPGSYTESAASTLSSIGSSSPRPQAATIRATSGRFPTSRTSTPRCRQRTASSAKAA